MRRAATCGITFLIAMSLIAPGPAGATHGAAEPTTVGLTLGPQEHVSQCITVTVSAASAQGVAEGETVDVTISMADGNVLRDISIDFCDPGVQWGSPTVGARDCDDDAQFATGVDTSAGCGSGSSGTEQPARATQGCVTGNDGRCVLGIRADARGTLSVLAFFDTDGDHEHDAGEPSATGSRSLAADTVTARNVRCEPESALYGEGARHEFRCLTTDSGGTPVSGVMVNFDVIDGPNADEVGMSQCGPTGGDGWTSPGCGYNDALGSGSLPGRDTIVVWVNRDHTGVEEGKPGPQPGEAQQTLSVTWESTGAGITCTPDGGSYTRGTTLRVTCLVSDADGRPIQNVSVQLEEHGPGSFDNGASSVDGNTNADGTYGVDFVNAGEDLGTTTVTGSLRPAACVQGAACSDTATFTWINVDDDVDNRFPTAVSLKYHAKRRLFRGRVATTVPECRGGRAIEVRKRVRGPDKLVGAGSTDPNGEYLVKRPRHLFGRFYAFVRKAHVAGPDGSPGTCVQDRSVKVAVRRR